MQCASNRAFRDPDVFLHALADRIWVACPACGGPALVRRHGPALPRRGVARLSCGSCGFASDDPAGTALATKLGLQARLGSAIRCDRCGGPQPIIVRRGTPGPGRQLTARIRCIGCGHVERYPLLAGASAGREAADPYFRLPLFLTERIGSETLWVYNADHLTLLEDWVGASIRRRALGTHKMTMLACLPRWMKDGAGRGGVMHALARLRRRALEAGIA